MTAVDEYLKNIKHSQKAELDKIRKLVKELVPEAEETFSYQMPAFKYKKKPLIYYAAFKDHMSIFPTPSSMAGELGDKLIKFRTSKGTLQFTEDHPIPEELLKELILQRAKIIAEK